MSDMSLIAWQLKLVSFLGKATVIPQSPSNLNMLKPPQQSEPQGHCAKACSRCVLGWSGRLSPYQPRPRPEIQPFATPVWNTLADTKRVREELSFEKTKATRRLSQQKCEAIAICMPSQHVENCGLLGEEEPRAHWAYVAAGIICQT